MPLALQSAPHIHPEEGEDPDGPFLEKIYLVEKALGMVDQLFGEFLALRLGDGWSAERSAVAEWIAREE